MSLSKQLALGKGIAAGKRNCWGLPVSPRKGGTDVVDLKVGGLEQHSQCQTQYRKQWL